MGRRINKMDKKKLQTFEARKYCCMHRYVKLAKIDINQNRHTDSLAV